MAGTYLLAMRCLAYRRHDSYVGFRTELENRVGDDKGKGTRGDPMRPKLPRHRSGAHCLVGARKRSNARGAKGAGHPRQVGVNGQPEELLVLAEAGRLPWGGTSRMNREVHVRICERLGVKIPGATRQRLPFPHISSSDMAHFPAVRDCFRRRAEPNQVNLHKLEHKALPPGYFHPRLSP